MNHWGDTSSSTDKPTLYQLTNRSGGGGGLLHKLFFISNYQNFNLHGNSNLIVELLLFPF